jgi:hypothetical protein
MSSLSGCGVSTDLHPALSAREESAEGAANYSRQFGIPFRNICVTFLRHRARAVAPPFGPY